MGTAINFAVAIPVTVEVPDLIGRSRQEARGILEGRELGARQRQELRRLHEAGEVHLDARGVVDRRSID